MKSIISNINNIRVCEREDFIFKLFLYTNSDKERAILNQELIRSGYNYSYLYKKANQVLSDFYKKNEERNSMRTMSQYIYAKEHYNEILRKTKLLAKELKLKNSLEVSYLFTFLLWRGYFSHAHQFKYDPKHKQNLSDSYALDIFKGEGLSLNISDMLNDFINSFNFASANLISDSNLTTYDFYNADSLAKQRTSKRKFFETPFNKKIASKDEHILNIISEGDKMYIYDAINFLIFDIENKYSIRNSCGRGTCHVDSFTSHSINFSDKSSQVLDSFNNKNIFSSPYDLYDFVVSQRNCRELFEDNICLLDEFHKDIHKDISEININYDKLCKRLKRN